MSKKVPLNKARTNAAALRLERDHSGLSQEFKFVDQKQIETVLVGLGCPPEKSAEMAAQLDKRAHQLAIGKGRDYEEALQHLIGLMRQGWAAKEKGL